ncbi:MAG TPA: alpha amylase C-terminal domain-containing protein, partial [Thermoanaerobaculia bacterium]|nr:alpha amylase C-terminal domain-containing protein [Thermoanaerobaculia bacterium]
PLSHDEVVHMKGSLLSKMPGDDWKKFANVRLLLAYQAAVPGKKLLFMGGEIGQWAEWDHDGSLQWFLLSQEAHAGIQRWAAALNRLVTAEPAMHELDFHPSGFEWVDFQDSPQSVIAFLRRDSRGNAVLAAFNFTPVPRYRYAFGVPWGGRWMEIANGDSPEYGGSGIGNGGVVEAERVPQHGRPWRVTLNLPPLAAVFLSAPIPPPEETETKVPAREAARADDEGTGGALTEGETAADLAPAASVARRVEPPKEPEE